MTVSKLDVFLFKFVRSTLEPSTKCHEGIRRESGYRRQMIVRGRVGRIYATASRPRLKVATSSSIWRARERSHDRC